eukprot:745837-Hanusia_phi.AAC.2
MYRGNLLQNLPQVPVCTRKTSSCSQDGQGKPGNDFVTPSSTSQLHPPPWLNPASQILFRAQRFVTFTTGLGGYQTVAFQSDR